jgi:hypothetical protein
MHADSPIGRALVIVGLFLAAWAVSRLAGLLVGWRHSLMARRHGGDPGAVDLVFHGKQRETAITLAETTVRTLAFLAAVALSIVELSPGRHAGAIAGASFAGVLIAFAAQRVLIDMLQGLFMFGERWFAVGDTVVIEPWDVEGVVETVSLRRTTLRGVNGELMHVHNSQILAVRVVPSGLREFEVELYVRDEELGRRLVDRAARLVPRGPTHFVRPPELKECEQLGDELVRVTAHTAVAPGREWLVESLLPSLLKEDAAADGQIVHGPVVMAVDETANRRFARIVSAREQARQPRLPLARLGSRRS